MNLSPVSPSSLFGIERENPGIRPYPSRYAHSWNAASWPEKCHFKLFSHLPGGKIQSCTGVPEESQPSERSGEHRREPSLRRWGLQRAARPGLCSWPKPSGSQAWVCFLLVEPGRFSPAWSCSLSSCTRGDVVLPLRLPWVSCVAREKVN